MINQIDNDLIYIGNIFKQETNISKNYIEYISALLYLKYSEESYSLEILPEIDNPYLPQLLNKVLTEFKRHLNNNILFSNINFLNIQSNKKNNNILKIIIKEIFNISTDKKNVAKWYEEFMQNCIIQSDIISESKEIFTPLHITNLIAKLMVDEEKEIFDPFCGSGNFLVSSCMQEKLNVVGNVDSLTYYNVCMTNLFLHDINNSNITYLEGKDNVQRYNLILSNPPFSQKNWYNLVSNEDRLFINNFGLLPSAYADYAFVLSMLNKLKDNGKLAVTLPHGTLFRQNEKEVRKRLLTENYIDTIVSLPENLFYNNRIPVIILIIKKKKTDQKVLFIDASQNYINYRKNFIISKDDQKKIISIYKNRQEKPNFSRLVSFEEIRNNDFNLDIKRYIKKENISHNLNLKELKKEIDTLKNENISLENEIEKVLKTFKDFI